jgi:hypothetical protein
MKPSSILATALAIVFWCVLPAAADNRLDITLEGPWILYEYTNPNFAGGKTVLVAITPGGVVPDYPEGSSMQQDPKLFHHVSLRTGDGYFIQRANIYCLAFEDKSGLHCGDFGNGTRLDPDGYPPAAGPLQVKVSQNWQWTHLTTATALILPMPNSYSNDGVWPMRFGRAYHPSGFEYKPWKTPKHSIAVQLHYENGPSGFNLFMCSDDLRKCTLPTGIDHTALENTGTLRIVMKSPENEDVCDLHVRHAYPRMLALLDLPNPEIAVIDPARGVKNDGAGDYDDPLNCLPNDEQGHALHEVPKPEKPPKLSKLTMDVVRALNRLADKAPDKKDELLLPKIATDIASASAGLDDFRVSLNWTRSDNWLSCLPARSNW